MCNLRASIAPFGNLGTGQMYKQEKSAALRHWPGVNPWVTYDKWLRFPCPLHLSAVTFVATVGLRVLWRWILMDRTFVDEAFHTSEFPTSVACIVIWLPHEKINCKRPSTYTNPWLSVDRDFSFTEYFLDVHSTLVSDLIQSIGNAARACG